MPESPTPEDRSGGNSVDTMTETVFTQVMTKHQEAIWQALLLFKLFQLMAGVER